jgi:predicted GIY-YIG superfamily endonuclease
MGHRRQTARKKLSGFKGKRMDIFGAFKSKKDAVEREREHKGAFIREKKIKGKTRFIVMRKNK